MRQMVRVSQIRDIRSKTQYKIEKDKDGNVVGGELVTTIAIEAVLPPADIGEVAKFQQAPDAASVLIVSAQYAMDVDPETGEIKQTAPAR